MKIQIEINKTKVNYRINVKSEHKEITAFSGLKKLGKILTGIIYNIIEKELNEKKNI